MWILRLGSENNFSYMDYEVSWTMSYGNYLKKNLIFH